MDDKEKLIKTMREFCAPEAQEKRLREKWSKASGIYALHYDMTNDPAPDGTFEILFVTPEEAEKAIKATPNSPYISKISFAAGVALARQPDCCGGQIELKDAHIIVQVNAEARRQNEQYGLGL